ncbi:MAG TPA: hypothetical protein VL551_28195 [Actinospica sp.]|jgi:hypothetical protein|nr:hypothetical protein [Actinospica sp.]
MTKAASTTNNVSETQRRALRLIADNPFRVLVRPRDEAGYLTISQRTEAPLIRRGLIRSVEWGKVTRTVSGLTFAVELYVWELTEAGRAILAPVESGDIVSSDVEQSGAVEVEESSPVDVLIDREGLDAGSALIYCRADARMDGRLGRTGERSRRVYVETYGRDLTGAETCEPIYVEASSPDAALRKLAKVLGITLGTITTER